ncbi:MAG: sulfatase [Bryobacterales bacterium]|nr:sulfatase [Bryobacterales bacterium]
MTQITRRAALTAIAGAPFLHAAPRRPNFLFLLTDDQSYSTLSLTGSPFLRTPNIDRIGSEGVLFTNTFVAMSLCAPSRACCLTGLYPHKNGIIGNQIRWNHQLQTLPRLLQSNGYRTAHIGKFHMDSDDRVHPGYDYYAAQLGQGQYVNPRKNINGKWVDLQGYDTDIVTDQAIEFMRASKDKPFCTWIGYKACHGPFTPAPGHETDFASLAFRPPDSFFLDDTGKPDRVRRKSQNPQSAFTAESRKSGKKKRKKAAGDAPDSLEAWGNRERDQYRCLMGVEDSVGRLLGFLDEEKLSNDTIVVYMGDNGFFHGEHGLHGKMEAYEEALRVPMLLRYPAAVKGNQRIQAFTSNIDIAPSVLDFCGIRAPQPMQGLSFKGLIDGSKGQPGRDSFVYTMHGGDAAQPTVKALRTRRHKLILNLNPKDKTELYDLQADPKEMKNLALQPGNAPLIADLKRKLIAEMKRIEDPAIAAVETS